MVLSSILVPLELNELLNCAGFKNLKLLGLIDQTHEIAITINKLNLIVVQVLSDVLSDLGQNVNGVGNLVDFAGVDLWGINIFFIIVFVQWRDVWEDGFIVVSELEDWVVVTTLISIVVSVRTGPIIEVKWETENVWWKQGAYGDTFFKKDWQVRVEQKAWNIGVLELHDVVDHEIHSFDLVASQCTIYGCPIVVTTIVAHFWDLVFVENGELLREEFLIFLVQECAHGSTVEREDWGHVWAIELQEWLIKDHRSRLLRNKLYDIRLGLTNVKTFEEKQFSQGDFMDLDAVDFFEACFFTTLSLRFLKLLLDWDDSVLFSAFEKDIVLWVNF